MEKLNPINAVIFDLDGTLSDCTHRMHYLDNKPKDFDSFYGAMGDDTVVKPVASMLRSLSGVSKLILTARPVSYSHITKEWLSKHDLLSHIQGLYTRPDEQRRIPDYLYKQSMIDVIRKEYNILLVIDDRDRVVDMWRENGIYCLQAKSIK